MANKKPRVGCNTGHIYVLVQIKGVEHHFWLDEAQEALRALAEAVKKAEHYASKRERGLT